MVCSTASATHTTSAGSVSIKRRTRQPPEGTTESVELDSSARIASILAWLAWNLEIAAFKRDEHQKKSTCSGEIQTRRSGVNNPLDTEKGPRGAPPRRAPSGAVGGDLLSHGAAPAVPSARGGLNFRVRHGAGCAPAAKAADRAGRRPARAPARALGAAWRARRTAVAGARGASAAAACGRLQEARPISAARLSASRRLHLRPIGLVVCEGPSEGGLISGTASRLDAFSAYPDPTRLPGGAVGRQPAHRRSVRPGPLVLGTAPLSPPTPAEDRDRTVSRRSEPSSRTALNGEQPYPWDLLRPQDAMGRHRGAKPSRRCGLLGKISLLSPEYLLSVERRPFHAGPPDH